MGFALADHEDARSALRRIAGERVEESLGALDGQAGEKRVSDESVHTARKRLKELRAVLRLGRSQFEGEVFEHENRTYRDAARPLSALRDAAVLIETLDELVEHFGAEVKAKVFEPLREALQERRRAAHGEVVEGRVLRGIVETLKQAGKRVGKWPGGKKGFGGIRKGLRRTYRQGRKAMEAAREDPSDEKLHEWRKRAKDLRYQLEVLTPVAPEVLGGMARDAKELTDELGKDHDLAVLHGLLKEELHGVLSKRHRQTVVALLEKRRKQLQKKARRLGPVVYAEKTANFVRRLETYWAACH